MCRSRLSPPLNRSGALRHQDEPTLCFSASHLLVGRRSFGERDRPIQRRSLEGSLLEEGGERLEHGRRGGRITFARVDPKQLALVVVKVEKVEAHPAVTHRGDLDLSAAMP